MNKYTALQPRPSTSVFITHAQEGLSCSLLEAQALTELVREVYCPRLAQPEAVELYLRRYTFTQIRQKIRHSLASIANYVVVGCVPDAIHEAGRRQV